MSNTTISFSPAQRDFTSTLNKRVNEYFKQNKMNRQANGEMKLKTIFMFSLYFIPYILIVGNLVVSWPWIILLLVIMSFGVAGIGLSVMHDANHGAYSKKPWINALFGYSLNLVGASSFNWKIQHNVMHHTFTNIHDHDEDISPRGVLRLSPQSEWKSMHKYQYIYAWFLYGLMTLVWVLLKDFVRLTRYNKDGLVKKQQANIFKEWAILIATKLFYVGYIFILAIIFQPAHVIEGTEYPEPDQDNKIENNWAVHQLHTTTNFSNKSRIFSWYVGGLNYQVEHHLFPNICHVHYRKISSIVKETATEFGFPYKSVRTFYDALHSHMRMLKNLGIKPT